MFKSKALLVGVLLALVATNVPALSGQDYDRRAGATGVSEEAQEDILGYYELDGGKTIILVREEKGVAERVPAGTSMEEWMAAHRMAPEAEALLVHEVPPVPFILDGVQYDPEQIHLFDGKQLGFTTGNDGRLYAFTSFVALNEFMNGQSHSALEVTGPDSVFYEYTNYQWQYNRLFASPQHDFLHSRQHGQHNLFDGDQRLRHAGRYSF